MFYYPHEDQTIETQARAVWLHDEFNNRIAAAVNQGIVKAFDT